MKKLMIAAATAAMIGGAFASAQVYDVTVSGNTTVAKKGTVSKNPFETKGTKITYRQKGSFKWVGIIWGCDCDAINGEWKVVSLGNQTVGGCAMWDAKSYAAVYLGRDTGTGVDSWGWSFLNAINLNGDGVEGLWMIEGKSRACDDSAGDYAFAGAGFGSSKNAGTCDGYITSISGNVAGFNYRSFTEKLTDCYFCEDNYECEKADAWEFCDSCIDNALMDIDKTAVSATWSIKYNSGLSKKLESTPTSKAYGTRRSIIDVYNFGKTARKPGLIAALIYAKEELVLNGPDCSEEEKALADAEGNLSDAEKDLAAAELIRDNAQDAYDTAAKAVDRAQEKLDQAELTYIAATNALANSSDAALLAAKNTAYGEKTAAANAYGETNALWIAQKYWTNELYTAKDNNAAAQDIKTKGFKGLKVLTAARDTDTWTIAYYDGNSLQQQQPCATTTVKGWSNVAAVLAPVIAYQKFQVSGKTINEKSEAKDYDTGTQVLDAVGKKVWTDKAAALEAEFGVNSTNYVAQAAKAEALKVDTAAALDNKNTKDAAYTVANYNYANRAVYQQTAKIAVENAVIEKRERTQDLEDAQDDADKAAATLEKAENAYSLAEEAVFMAEQNVSDAEEALENCQEGIDPEEEEE